MMTTETRILTALQGGVADRVPVFVYLNPYREDEWYSRDPSYAAVLAACARYGDAIWDWYFPSGFFHTAAPLEREQRVLANGDIEHIVHTPTGPLTSIARPHWRGMGTVKRWVTTPEDAERLLSIPYVPAQPDLSPLLAARGDARWVVQATFEDPICSAGLIDETALALWTVEERALLTRLLDTAAARIGDELDYCLSHSVGPLYYFNGPEYALPPLMSPRDFDAFVVAYDTPLIARVHAQPGCYTIVHSHGKVNHFLERFAAMGTDGLNVLEPPPLGDTDLVDAKRRIGDRVCLIGNIQYHDIAHGDGDAVESLVRDTIAAGGPNGFILSPCASPYESPLPATTAEYLIRYLEAGYRYGGG